MKDEYMMQPAPMPRWLVDAVTKPKAYISPEPPKPASNGANGSPSAYAAKALESELALLEAAPLGERNDSLNTSAFKLGTLVGAGALQESTVIYELERTGVSIGLPADEVHKTVRSGMEAGMREPRDMGDIGLLQPLRKGSLQETSLGTKWARSESGFATNGESVAEDVGSSATDSTSGIDPRWWPQPISTLEAPEEDMAWIWQGYAGAGLLTLFTGLWKSGKSTLLAYLLQGLDGRLQEFAGQYITPCKTLVITEEPKRKWVERRDELGLQDHIHVIPKPFLKNPSNADWERFVAFIAREAVQQSYQLVIFDSLFNLWPVRDENNAAEVRGALTPMHQLTEAGVSVILVAHPKKGDAGEGQATRGSGAAPAFVDIILEFRRFDAERREDTRRVLTSYSRFDAPPEVVVEFAEGAGYTARGTRADAKGATRREVIQDVLPDEDPGLTIEEILEAWPDDHQKPARRTLAYDLDFLAKDIIIRKGSGKRNDAYKYRRSRTDVSFLASSIPLRDATNNIDAEEDAGDWALDDDPA